MFMSQRINAGYTINDSLRIGDTEFVIGYNPKYTFPYVVWECINGNNYYWGRYVNDRTSAECELLNRAMNARNQQGRFMI